LLQRWRELRTVSASEEYIGRTAAAAVLQVGSSLPVLLRPKEANALALDACRYVAASERGELAATPRLSVERSRAVVSLVADWSRNLMLQPFARDYRPGTAAEVAGQAATMWRDADTCADIMRRAGYSRRASDDNYRQAAEGHAYAAVTTDPAVLERLPFRDAKRLAAAADASADAVLANPMAAPGEDLDTEEIASAAREVKASVDDWRSAVVRLSLSAEPPDIGDVADALEAEVVRAFVAEPRAPAYR
jgi:hypothetical protein